MEHLNQQALGHVAEYFRALGDPMRLRILNSLREGERKVGELTGLLDCSQANVSKHLSTLSRMGLVRRDARGTSVYYGIADPSVYALCDLVCGQLGRHFAQTAELGALFAPADAAPARAKRNRAPAPVASPRGGTARRVRARA